MCKSEAGAVQECVETLFKNAGKRRTVLVMCESEAGAVQECVSDMKKWDALQECRQKEDSDRHEGQELNKRIMGFL